MAGCRFSVLGGSDVISGLASGAVEMRALYYHGNHGLLVDDAALTAASWEQRGRCDQELAKASMAPAAVTGGVPALP